MHSAGMQMTDGPPPRPLRAVPGPSDGELMARSVDEPECFAVLFDRHATTVPLMTVTVQGRPAYLVRIDAGGLDTGWYLQAQFADGTTFVVQAPAAFTQEQVLQFAGEVTHNR